MNQEEKKKHRREYMKIYRLQNLEKFKTPMRRANKLIGHYNSADKKYGRGEGNLTSQWIVDNIFTQPCAHCGKTGWKVIGCNRLDNSKPHTMDNVEPCCRKCNAKLRGEDIKKERNKQVYQYTLDGELVAIWSSTMECGRNGYTQGCIAAACKNNYYGANKYKGYIWSYIPL